MGDHLRQLTSVRAHQQFSRSLSRFSSEVERIIEQNNGTLIYSGGDDVMAYIPVHQCIQVCEELQKIFVNEMKNAIPDPNQIRPTLSIGVAIAHMMEPLGEVRKLAAKAEQMAKSRRNELAIIYQKRSGGDAMNVSLSFDHNPFESIRKLQDCYRQGLFSAKFAYEIRALHDEYFRMLQLNPWVEDDHALLLLLTNEIERLVWKKKPADVEDGRIECQLLPALRNQLNGGVNALESVRMLAELLIISVILEKAGNALHEDIEDQTS